MQSGVRRHATWIWIYNLHWKFKAAIADFYVNSWFLTENVFTAIFKSISITIIDVLNLKFIEWYFMLRQVKFNNFLHPNKHPQRTFDILKDLNKVFLRMNLIMTISVCEFVYHTGEFYHVKSSIGVTNVVLGEAKPSYVYWCYKK